MVTVADGLTVVVPSTGTDTAKYIDVPIEHINDIQLTEGGPGSQPRRKTQTKPAVLAFHVSGTPYSAYYINECGCAPCGINLAFDTLDDASFIREQIERRMAQHKDIEGRSAGGTTPTPDGKDARYPAIEFNQSSPHSSHSASLSISDSHRGQDVTTSHKPLEASQGMPSIDSMATALDAHNQKAISTHKQQKLDTETSQEGKVEVRRASPAPSTSMLAGKYPAYVRKKSSHGEIPSHGRSNSDDAFNIGPISSAIWREGLYTIETAKELNPKPPAAQPPVNTESGPQKNSGLGDKPNPMTLPRKALQSSPKTSLDPRRGNGKSNLLLGAPAEGSRARKLCHSMRVGENEREPAPFSTAGDKKLSAHKSKTSLTKQDVLSGPRSNTSKRKNVAVEAAVANKKRNVKDAATDKLEAANDDPYHVDAHAEGGEFDIPDTPPDQNTVGIAKKSKVSNVKAKTKAPKADSKAPNSATRTSKLGAFSAASTQKAARISALDESNHDHDMVDDQAETPNGVENNNCSELARKQPRKAQPAAPKPSQPTKKRQPAEPRSKNKTTKATDNAPVRPPRQRRAAAEKATRQMRYIGDNSDNKAQGQFMADGAEVEDKLQQGSAQKNESKRSSRNGKAVRKALESSTLEKDGDKARRLGESTAEQPNQNADFAAEQDATLGYSTSHSQQPPFQDQSPAQLPLGQLKQTTMKPVEVVDRASHQPQVISPQQRIATSNVKPLQPVALSAADAEGSAQDLADPKEANLYINMSEANPATSEVALENPKAPSVDKDDVHAEVEDTHFEDAIQTLLLEAEDPSVHGAYLHQQGDTSVHQEQNSDVHSLSAAEEDVILIDMTKEGPIKEKSDKIEGAAIAKMETGRSEMTIGLPGVRENRFQENNNTGPPVQNIAASNSANTDQSKVLYQELQNQPADSRTAEPDAQSSGIPVYTRPEPPPEISEALQNPRDPGRSRRSMTPALLLHEDGAASTVSGRKKRGFDGMDQQPRSRKKQKRTPQANRAMDRSVNNTTLLKDPRRLPQVIGFSAEGPRNQGLSSLAIGLGASEQEGQMNERTSKFGFVQKQKRARRTVFANTSEPSGPGSPLAHVHHKADDAPIMELDGNTALSIDAFSEQPVPTESGPRRQPKGPLLTHSSLFVGESAPRYSSQGSRVDEKGSPLPSRRIHGASHRLKDVQQASESEDAEYPLDDDETRIIRRAEEEALEPDLPPLAAPSLGRKKQVGFSGSSNSKYGPSSPNAPSAIVAEAQPHTIESDGRFVNVETAAVLEPSNLQDPFASRKLPPFNGFLDKLRRASQGRAQAGHEALRDTGSMKPPTKVAPTAGEDPDETLVEGRLNRPRKRRQTTPAATDTSATSSSEEQQSPPSDLSDAYGQRWRDALEPHQHNMLAVLYELSHVS